MRTPVDPSAVRLRGLAGKPARSKNDAKELLEIGDVVCGADAAADLDVVIVPLQQSLLTEAQCRGTVGQRLVWQGRTEYSYASTSRIPRSMQAANHSTAFRKYAP
jgi:hypothetical protein